MTKETTRMIEEMIRELDLSDAKAVGDMVNQRILDIRRRQAAEKRLEFKAGDRVVFNAGKRGRITGTIERFNQTTVRCRSIEGQPWIVPLSLVDRA